MDEIRDEIEYIEEAGKQPVTGANFSAKKSLGQNFLHAPNVISAMIKAGKVEKDDIVLEVGPGKGALTIKLLEAGAHVIAVEKDDRAIPFLQKKFAESIKNGQLELIHGDILEIDINDYINKQVKIAENSDISDKNQKNSSYTVIANIPYYITGEFIRKFLESERQPRRMVVMVQKEVAKRAVDTKESILSISIKAYGEPKYLVTVPRKFFRPMPNVDSAVLVIENISKNFFNEAGITEAFFFEVVKAGFAHKRKILIKNLEEKIPKEKLVEIWQKNNFSKDIRAENISLEMWKKIVGDSRNS